MRRDTLIESIKVAYIAHKVRDDYMELSGADCIDFKVINSGAKLKRITGIEKKLLSIPSVYIKFSNGREFIVDRNKRLITRVGKDWVYVQDTGWFEWRDK